ncbi:hypothetical protein [Embleya sp. NBC_00896]|uniref:hypothetical protein n=1 Tax=Embleya sp. NBC_00896 TaxID=2975961 RepID=UPI002F90DBFE|nr:hypothetical protein OG928_33395 [Embleya sp. NBC_00896]
MGGNDTPLGRVQRALLAQVRRQGRPRRRAGSDVDCTVAGVRITARALRSAALSE